MIGQQVSVFLLNLAFDSRNRRQTSGCSRILFVCIIFACQYLLLDSHDEQELLELSRECSPLGDIGYLASHVPCVEELSVMSPLPECHWLSLNAFRISHHIISFGLVGPQLRPENPSFLFLYSGSGPLDFASRPDREDLRSKSITIHFLWTKSFDSATQVKTFLKFLGVAGGTDRGIVLPPPLVKIERD